MGAAARALRASAALALLGAVACGGESPPGSTSPAVSAPAPGAAVGGAGGSATPAVGGPPVCRVPDDLALLDEDADGGVAPDCHDIHRTIITENCIGYCHHNRAAPSGGLNLQSPCVADRMLDVTSRCEGLPYIDSKDPRRSFLLDKLEHAMPRCGKSMPEGWHLPPNQVACMNAWVHAVVRSVHKP